MAKRKGKEARDRVPDYVKKEEKEAKQKAKKAEKKKLRREKDKANPKRVKRRKMLKRIRVISLWMVGIFIFLLTILAILSVVYEDKIASKLIEEMNKSLKEPIEINEVDLNLVRSFPNASVNFKEIRVPDAFGETLLRAEKMAFKFNVMSLLGSTYKIKSVVIDDGFLRILKDDVGSENYDIFKETGQETESSEEVNFNIALEKTTLKNIILRYNDEVDSIGADVHLERLDLSGNFSNNQTQVKTFAEISTNYISFKGDKYVPNALISWNLDVDADFENGAYELGEAELTLNANTFKANGKVTETDDGQDIDLHLRGDDCTIASVIALLPTRYKKLIKDFNSSGNFYFNVDVEGLLGGSKTPAVNAEFGLSNGQITSPRLGESLKKVNFDAKLASKQDMDSFSFVMNGFEAVLDKRLLAIDLSVLDANNPRIDFRMNGDVNMGLVYKLSDNPLVKDARGLVKFQDLIVNGRFNDMVNPERLSRVDASGIIETEGFNLKYKDENFRMQDGYLTFTNDLVTMRNISLFGAGSDFELDMNIYNVIPVMLGDSAQRATNKIRFEGMINAENVDFDRLMALGIDESQAEDAKTTTVDTSSSEEYDTEGDFDYTSLVEGTFTANVRRFNFRKVKGENFAGTVEYNNKEVIFKNVGVDVMDGNVKMTSNFRLKGKPKLEAFIEFDDIDGKRFFYEGENFGQTELMDKNIVGRMDGKVLVNAYWDEAFNFLDKKLYVLLDLTIRDGELNDVKMFEDFSRIIKVEDLRRVKFTDMRNQLRIQNGELTIPTMFIQSNALNLTLAGIYGFNNDVNFSFKINGSQVIANKFRRFNPSYAPKRAKRSGWFNIYASMKGNLDGELKVDAFDKKNVLDVFNNRLQADFVDIQNNISTQFKVETVSEPTGWDDGDDTGNDDGNDDDDGAFGDF